MYIYTSIYIYTQYIIAWRCTVDTHSIFQDHAYTLPEYDYDYDALEPTRVSPTHHHGFGSHSHIHQVLSNWGAVLRPGMSHAIGHTQVMYDIHIAVGMPKRHSDSSIISGKPKSGLLNRLINRGDPQLFQKVETPVFDHDSLLGD